MDNRQDSEFFTDFRTVDLSAAGDRSVGKISFLSLLYASTSSPVRLHVGTRYGKRYIIKSVQEEFADVPFWRSLLRKEFEIGINLDHPNIRRTISFESDASGREMIVLEYVDGRTLEDFLKEPNVNAALIRRICTQLASALYYLHAKQIIHRDLKPSNVLITYGGDVAKLIDFSLADGAGYTLLKDPAGTRAYVAPEVIEDESADSVRSDIYSLGKIIGEMADASGDRELKHIARQCVQADPTRRPASVADTGLLMLSAGKRGSMLSPSSPRWTRILVTFLVIILLFLIILLIVSLLSPPHSIRIELIY